MRGRPAAVGDLFKVEGTPKQHNSKLDQQFIFNRTKTPNTPPGCVKAIWPRRGDWSTVCPDLNRVELLWDEMHLRANQTGQQVLSISGNAVKTGGKPVQVNP